PSLEAAPGGAARLGERPRPPDRRGMGAGLARAARDRLPRSGTAVRGRPDDPPLRGCGLPPPLGDGVAGEVRRRRPAPHPPWLRSLPGRVREGRRRTPEARRRG